ncbi:hypothetical protein ACH4D3_13765 [Streptomyces sp. NPDC018026]|uniref:hypothetical protein n=1 Tax=Streptomyces sp. NPDC018026 TaxID=3365031 RepID=UPI0037A6CF83
MALVLDQTRAAVTAGFDRVRLNQRTSRAGNAPTTLAIMGREVPDIEFGTSVVPRPQFAGGDHRRVVGRAGVEAEDSRPMEQGLSLTGPGGLIQQMNRDGIDPN